MIFETEQDYFKQFNDKKGALRLGFGSTYSQSHRYGILTKDLLLKNTRCVLLGCGYGAGVPFLQAKGCEDIFGFDLLPENIKMAKERFPDLKDNFFVIDKTTEVFEKVDKIDWIIASGTWNVKTKKKYEKINELLVCSNFFNGIATNFTTNVSDSDDAHNFCPLKIIQMFIDKFNNWKVDRTYFKNDFSIWGYNPK